MIFLYKKSFIIFIFFCISTPTLYANESRKCAILLHGLARSSFSMSPIKRRLERQGFKVWNETYPSTQKTIENLSPIISKALEFCDKLKTNEIYFVSHSMGGILIRHHFQNKTDSRVKAIVMLAPPNHGSEIVDAYKDKEWFKWLNGPAGLELTTNPESLPNTLAPLTIPIGVIAGDVNNEPWFAHLFNGPSDGKVSVESTKLKEMKDFLVVHHGHTFMMNSKDVFKQIAHFFKDQSFIKD